MSPSAVNTLVQLTRAGGQRHADARSGQGFENLRIGQQIRISVLNRIDERNFLISVAGGRHVVESSVPLVVGQSIRAVVVAVGDRLELRYLDSVEEEAPEEDSDPSAEPPDLAAPVVLLSNLAERYRLTLGGPEQAHVQRAMAGADDPLTMAIGGLYLAKLGTAVRDETLQAVYAAQRDVNSGSDSRSTLVDISSLVSNTVEGDSDSTSRLAALLAEAIPQQATDPASLVNSNGARSGDEQPRDQLELARWLLNLQDDGSVAYRYGTLPVLVAGQLVELDVVLFQQRQPSGESTPMRRLVMTLKTESFGPVQVQARALDNRLVITFTGTSTDATDELSAYADEVRELVSRLGWAVEAVGYELSTPGRASKHIVEHVLSAGTVDVVF